MVFKYLKSGVEVTDNYFDSIYPKSLRPASEFHFTPVEVAKSAARILVEHPGMKVLDIGSGAGKFCLIGAACTEGHFTGVEQREKLYRISNRLAKYYGLANVSFLHSNILEIEFDAYDAFYFFNAFYENINLEGQLGGSVTLDRQLYGDYSSSIRQKLDAKPAGTRLVTYFSYSDEVPASYELLTTGFNGYLKTWEKRG